MLYRASTSVDHKVKRILVFFKRMEFQAFSDFFQISYNSLVRIHILFHSHLDIHTRHVQDPEMVPATVMVCDVHVLCVMCDIVCYIEIF